RKAVFAEESIDPARPARRPQLIEKPRRLAGDLIPRLPAQARGFHQRSQGLGFVDAVERRDGGASAGESGIAAEVVSVQWHGRPLPSSEVECGGISSSEPRRA